MRERGREKGERMREVGMEVERREGEGEGWDGGGGSTMREGGREKECEGGRGMGKEREGGKRRVREGEEWRRVREGEGGEKGEG